MMDMGKLWQLLLVKMEANKEEMKANRKTEKEERKKDMEEMEADHKELLTRLEDDRQAERRFLKEMMQIMDSQMETTDAPGRHQGNQESRLRGPATA
jgi:hypothetical protein